MDIDINYQKIIKKLKIRLFKSERYFVYFKTLLISFNLPPDEIEKRIKVYNLIQSKHSIQKRQTTKFWYSLYILFQKPSIEFEDELNLLEEKYIQYTVQLIYKYLYSIALTYSAEIDLIKQEYLNLCIKFINHTKNKRLKTLKILKILKKQDSLKKPVYDTKNKENTKNELNNNKSKSSDDEEENEKNNSNKFDNKRPKTMLEKEIFRLKMKSSNEVVDEFIGDINNDLLIKKKKEICFLHNIKVKKNNIFKRFLAKQTKKVLNEMNANDLLYNKKNDKYETIFSLEMQIMNENYRKSKKKKEKINLKLKSNNFNNDNNRKRYLSEGKSKQKKKNKFRFNSIINSSSKKRMNLSPDSIQNKNNLTKCFSFKLKKGNSLFLPFLPKKEDNILKTVKNNNFINKKYFINGNDLFY